MCHKTVINYVTVYDTGAEIMRNTAFVCAAILGLVASQAAQAAQAGVWDAGIVSTHVKVEHRQTPDTTQGGVWDAGTVSTHVKVEHPQTPDTTQGGVWDGGITEHVKVKYPDTPQ